MRNIIIFLLAFSLFGAQCEKNRTPTDSFYFRCYIDGKEYIPNNCANCITCTVYRDTIFLLAGNKGYEALAMGLVIKPVVSPGSYSLNNPLKNGGTYKNSTLTNDRYDTDSLRKGLLKISSIDNVNKIISGTFYFKAYNPYRNDSINVTNGSFRLKYNTN